MKVLVTGATGFIGSQTAKKLVHLGHQVLATGRSDRQSKWFSTYGIEYSSCDLNEPAAVDRLLQKGRPDTVVHLAWHADPSTYLTARLENVASLAASQNVLVAAERVGCERVVLGGTCLENDAGHQTTVYARTKRLMHDVAAEYFEGDGPTTACAHIFSVYGPREHRDRAIPSIISALRAGEAVDLTDGAPYRDYLHVDDVASALATIAEAGITGGIDVCSGSSRTLREIFTLLGEILGRPDLLRFGARPTAPATSFDAVGDPARLVALGWAPAFSLEDGLRATAEEFSVADQSVDPT